MAGQRRGVVAGRRRQHRLRRRAASPRPAHRASPPAVPARSPRTTSSPTTSPPATAVASFSHRSTPRASVIRRHPTARRVYVGGDFTTVDGGRAQPHRRVQHRDRCARSRPSSPRSTARSRGIAATNTTVYVGGNFSNAGGQARTRLAAFNAANGALLAVGSHGRRPSRSSAMVLTPDGLQGRRRRQLHDRSTASPPAASVPLDATTGADPALGRDQPDRSPTAATSAASPASPPTANQVYGSGFAFGCGNFEGDVRRQPATPATSTGSTTATATPTTPSRSGRSLYTVSHAHNCSVIGGFPNSSPTWSDQHAPRARLHDQPDRHQHRGRRLRLELHRRPGLVAAPVVPRARPSAPTPARRRPPGRVTGNSNYVVLGGEFPTVNGTAQQGLVRFAVKTIAPNKRGPVKAAGAPAPAAQSFTGGHGARLVAVGVRHGQHDADLQRLPVRHDGAGRTRRPQDSKYWNYPMMGFIDTASRRARATPTRSG